MAKQKKAQEVSAVRQAKHGWIITLLFTVLSVLWISPIFMVLLNSFKRKAYIFKHPFGISTVSITEGFEAFKDGMSRLFCIKLQEWSQNDTFLGLLWKFTFHHSRLSSTYCTLLLNVCMVHSSCKD